jgi:hypothetical protein
MSLDVLADRKKLFFHCFFFVQNEQNFKILSDVGAYVPSMCNVVYYSFCIFLYWSLYVSA